MRFRKPHPKDSRMEKKPNYFQKGFPNSAVGLMADIARNGFIWAIRQNLADSCFSQILRNLGKGTDVRESLIEHLFDSMNWN
jgi:hypothetical protein